MSLHQLNSKTNSLVLLLNTKARYIRKSSLGRLVVLLMVCHLDFSDEFKIRGRSLCPFIASLRV